MRIFALLLALTVAGAVQAVTAWPTATVSKAATAELRTLIQQEHQSACGRSLTHDPQLRWVARWKAIDMGFRDDLNHRTVDGHEAWDFYDRAGIPHPYGAGEILGVNTYPLETTAQAIFDGWLGSPGHRGLIRNCDYDRFGVGAFRTRDTRWYAVEFTNVARP